jgi:hypothetical protein
LRLAVLETFHTRSPLVIIIMKLSAFIIIKLAISISTFRSWASCYHAYPSATLDSRFSRRLQSAGTSDITCASKFIPPQRHRDHFGALLQKEGLQVGAEIGVKTGAFAQRTLRLWNKCKRYYLIDQWRGKVRGLNSLISLNSCIIVCILSAKSNIL